MRLPLQRSLVALTIAFAVGPGAVPALANPVLVGPPPLVDGQPVPMPTVKKWGQYWYPASLVGHNRGIAFSFDHASNTLYADGSKLELDTLVVDGVVYIPLQPNLSMSDLRPGLTALQARRSKYEEGEASMPERAGNTESLFMETEVEMEAHPWADAPTHQPTGPVIDLDATGVSSVPAHMQPHAVPSQGTPGALPGRLPRPSDIPPVQSPQEASVVPTTAGIPLRVATQGGPQAGPQAAAALVPAQINTQVSSNPAGLQPIPTASVAPAAGPTAGGSVAIPASRGKNQAFEVLVLSGSLKSGPSDRLLALKLNQKNLSPVAQANLGSFALRCEDGSRIEPVKSRSVMPEGTLAPGGVREGELLFRLTPSSRPAALELEGTLPLSVDLAP